MKIKIIILSLLAVSILQGAEHNSLGVFYPHVLKPLITTIPWNATNKEISRRTKNSFINQKEFPQGTFVYLINETESNFSIEMIVYNKESKKYVEPTIINDHLLNLNLENCSYIVYNGGKELEYNSLSTAVEFINKAYKNKIPCVINYPKDKKAEILPLTDNKETYHFSSWNDIKEQWAVYGFTFSFLTLIWYINPFSFF